jgi:hypothetical protein
VDSVDDMAAAILAARTIDPAACRETASRRFPLSGMIDAYFTLYSALASADLPHGSAEGVA